MGGQAFQRSPESPNEELPSKISFLMNGTLKVPGNIKFSCINRLGKSQCLVKLHQTPYESH